MLLKIIVVLSLFIGAIVAEEEVDKKPKPPTTTTTTTPIYTTGTRTKPTSTTTTTVVYTTETTPIPTTTTTTTPYHGTGSTIRWTTTPSQPIAPICCAGQNQIYLPPGIAPYCQVYCKDIAKKCQRRYDILEPFGCYCQPGFCLYNNKCEPYSKVFKKCK